MNKHIVRISLGIVIVLLFIGHASNYYRLPLIDRLEAIVYDTRLQLTMPRTVDDRIVIVDIDEKSLRSREEGGEGRWPWPRNRLALMLDMLFKKYDAAVVGFDVVFPEPDQSSGLNVLQEIGEKQLKDIPQYQQALAQLEPQLQYDNLFAEAIKNRPVVLGYYFSNSAAEGEKATTAGALPPPVLPPGTFAGKNIGFTSWSGFGASLPQLVKNAARCDRHVSTGRSTSK